MNLLKIQFDESKELINEPILDKLNKAAFNSVSNVKKDEHNRTKDSDLWKEYGEDLIKNLPPKIEVKYDNF